MIRQWTFLYFFIITGSIYVDAQETPLCATNSASDICGTMCEPSCINPQPKFCPRIVCTNITRGCRCDDGFLRDPDTGDCVRPFQCKTCPSGETLLPCGATCEGTCEAPSEPKLCRYMFCLLPGCGCDLNNGMVRDSSTNRCVPKQDCAQGGDNSTAL